MPLPVVILLCVLGFILLLFAVCAVRAACLKKTLPGTHTRWKKWWVWDDTHTGQAFSPAGIRKKRNGWSVRFS